MEYRNNLKNREFDKNSEVKPTPPSGFGIKSFALSDVGYVRKNNEDAWKILLEHHFFILADGMGGHNAGEIASALTVETLSESIHTLSEEASIQETCRFLRTAVSHANTRVFESARADPTLNPDGHYPLLLPHPARPPHLRTCRRQPPLPLPFWSRSIDPRPLAC